MTDVLIVGAGAAGLTLAIDLARRSVPFRLIDGLVAPFAGSRGKGIQPRTLEVFEDLGIVGRLAAVGGPYPAQRRHRSDRGHEDARNMAVEAPTVGEPYRAPLLVPQFSTESVMRERLAAFGAAPEYGRTLARLDQDGDGVTAEIAGPDGPETIRCRYLVGADGGRSFVRHALDVGFLGKTLGVRAIVADIRLDGLSRDVWHWFNDGDMERQVSFCPLPHGDLFQLQGPIPTEGGTDLSVAGIQSLVDSRVTDRAIVVREVSWASAYGMNARLADRYRVGRVVLVGDAAHIHPPTGGQGLNTSVQDAYNLGWKLEGMLAGAPDALLDSYEAERRPVAADMLGLATGLLDKARKGDFRRGREVHQLDLGYRDAPLSLIAPRLPGSDVMPGDRAPDARLVGDDGLPKRLFDLFRGPHWTLIAAGDQALPLPASGPRLHVHRIGIAGELRDADGSFQAAYGLSDGSLMLVRPDGYVGAMASDRAEIMRYLASIYGESGGLARERLAVEA